MVYTLSVVQTAEAPYAFQWIYRALAFGILLFILIDLFGNHRHDATEKGTTFRSMWSTDSRPFFNASNQKAQATMCSNPNMDWILNTAQIEYEGAAFNMSMVPCVYKSTSDVTSFAFDRVTVGTFEFTWEGANSYHAYYPHVEDIVININHVVYHPAIGEVPVPRTYVVNDNDETIYEFAAGVTPKLKINDVINNVLKKGMTLDSKVGIVADIPFPPVPLRTIGVPIMVDFFYSNRKAFSSNYDMECKIRMRRIESTWGVIGDNGGLTQHGILLQIKADADVSYFSAYTLLQYFLQSIVMFSLAETVALVLLNAWWAYQQKHQETNEKKNEPFTGSVVTDTVGDEILLPETNPSYKVALSEHVLLDDTNPHVDAVALDPTFQTKEPNIVVVPMPVSMDSESTDKVIHYQNTNSFVNFQDHTQPLPSEEFPTEQADVIDDASDDSSIIDVL